MDLLRTQPAPTSGIAQSSIMGLGPSPAKPASSIGRTLMIVAGVVVLAIVIYYIYKYFRSSPSTPSASDVSSATDLVPSELTGRAATTIAASSFPVGDNNDYGVNFWVYIKDWDFNFGREKTIFSRGRNSPTITLHPTDNSLNVKVGIFSAGTNVSTTTAAGDVFTCTVENVPLQAWFAVSVTVFQRNLDIYINGQLVKSCVLPGVPRLASGDGTVGSSTTGFSGSVCTMKYLPRAMVPSDAMAFFSAGTPCGTAGGSKKPAEGITIFGYTFTFSIFKRGENKPTYTLSTP